MGISPLILRYLFLDAPKSLLGEKYFFLFKQNKLEIFTQKSKNYIDYNKHLE
jgi:hypothetical protein